MAASDQQSCVPTHASTNWEVTSKLNELDEKVELTGKLFEDLSSADMNGETGMA